MEKNQGGHRNSHFGKWGSWAELSSRHPTVPISNGPPPPPTGQKVEGRGCPLVGTLESTYLQARRTLREVSHWWVYILCDPQRQVCWRVWHV